MPLMGYGDGIMSAMDRNTCEVCGRPIPYRPHDGPQHYVTVRFCSQACRGVHVSRMAAGRFWDKVKKTPTCWLWMGNRSSRGYGRVTYLRRATMAHRIAWELANGATAPQGSQVMHICDNPPCVNPAHLLLGTASMNTHDMVMKGRGYASKLKGSEIGTSKLNEANVIEIRTRRAAGEAGRALAKEFGVSPKLVRLIVTREYWKHVA